MTEIIPETKIQDYNSKYAFYKPIVGFFFKLAYRKYEVRGLENLPRNGSTIFAPNHANALMDPLVVLFLDERAKVFVARADIFKNPKIARLLHFFKIMPIMRLRDGLEEVKKNNVTITKAIDVLKDRVPFSIHPEGRHRSMHSLIHPLTKGIFRIAFQAEEVLSKEDIPLYIVPIGLEYGNYYRFRSSVLTNIGKPINIRDYIADHPGLTTAEMTNALREDLFQAMKKNIIYIPDDEFYDATTEICATVYHGQKKRYLKLNPEEKRGSLLTRANTNKMTIDRITGLRESRPEEMNALFAKAEAARELRLKKKISLNSLIIRHPFWSCTGDFLIVLLTLPYTLPASILTLPIVGLSSFILSKLKDPVFNNSIKFVTSMFLWPILWIVYTAVFFCTLPWEWALGISVALVPATILTQDAFKLLRLFISDAKLLLNRGLLKRYREIRRLFLELL